MDLLQKCNEAKDLNGEEGVYEAVEDVLSFVVQVHTHHLQTIMQKIKPVNIRLS